MNDTLDNSDEITSVFGLTRAQLKPIINGIVADGPVAAFDVTIDHQIQGFRGYSAEKVIPTFNYITESGRRGRIAVFIKRFHRTGPAEAHHYAHLQRHGAPIPQMYGVMTDPEGREMLFLEYLEPIGDVHACEHFMSELHNFRCLLDAAAHFNAVRPYGEYAAQLPRKEVGKGLMDACITLEHIWEHACKGDLGEDFKQFCSGSQDKLLQIQALAESLMEPVSQMEMGLIHSDVYPENTGWRRGKRELLILDLEWIGFGPRFYDAASLLGAPDELQPHHRKRDELARYYMERYARWGGEIAPLSEFMREISALWIAQTLGIMWFRLARALDGQVDWTEDREQGRRFFRDGLKESLSILMRKADRY